MRHHDVDDCGDLTLADLARIQQTVIRRVAARDRDNIWAIGFGPKVAGRCALERLSVRFLVRRKKERLATSRRIPARVVVRLRDPASGRYRALRLTTDVEPARPPRASGVTVRFGQRTATTAVVVRWSDLRQPQRDFARPGKHDWHWGLLTVAHLLSGLRHPSPQPSDTINLKIARRTVCGEQPAEISGQVVARGRLPGGPDAMLVETGRDRLWLSGLLPQPGVAALTTVDEVELLRWLSRPAAGYLYQNGQVTRWQFSMLLPQYTIAGLGNLSQLIRFTVENAADENGADETGGEPDNRLLPGTSGSILVEAGRPAAMQVAAETPQFRVGYAQHLEPVQNWLRDALGAQACELVHVF